MIDRLVGAPMRNCSSSPSVATSLSPVCAWDAPRAVGLATTAFTGSTATPPVRRIDAAACWSTVVLRGKMPRGRPGPEQNP